MMIDATVAPKVEFVNPFGTTGCNVNHTNAGTWPRIAGRSPLGDGVPRPRGASHRYSPSDGERTNPEHLRGGRRHLSGTLVAEEGARTREIAQPAREPGRPLRATGTGQWQEHLAPAFRLAGIAASYLQARLRRDTAETARCIAQKAARVHHQWLRPAAPGHIPGSAAIVTLETSAGRGTYRTSH